MSEEKLKNIIGLKKRDIGEVEAYFEGIRQGVALACSNTVTNALMQDDRRAQLMKIVDSHYEVWRMGVEW